MNHPNNLNIPQLDLPESVEQVHGMLAEFLGASVDKARRLAVENCIARCLEQPSKLELFVALLRMKPDAPGLVPGTRQLAAVLMRKKLLTLWRILNADQQRELKAILMELIGLEPRRADRLAFASLVVIIARVELRESVGGWPELLQSLHDAIAGGNPDFVEMSMKLITSLAETLLDLLRYVRDQRKQATGGNNNSRRNNNNNQQQQQQILERAAREEQMLLPLIRDGVAAALRNGSTPAVRVAALEAVNSLLPHVHGLGDLKRDIISSLLPAALDCVVQAATANSHEGLTIALKTMDVLGDMLEFQGKQQLPFVQQAVDFLVTTASQRTLHPRLREQAVELLNDFVVQRPTVVVKAQQHNRFFNLALDLMSEDERLCLAELSSDADVQQVLDQQREMAQVQKEQRRQEQQQQGGGGGGNSDDDDDDLDDGMNRVLPPCILGGRLVKVMSMNIRNKIFAPLVISAASSAAITGEPLRLKAAMVALGCAAEGCSAQLRKQISPVVGLAERMFNTGSNNGNGNSAGNLNPINAPPFVREAAVFALGLFCRHLQPEINAISNRTLPMLLSQLADDVEDVRVSAARSLELLCETLDADALAPFAQSLLERLVGALTANTVGPLTQFHICGVISAVVDAQCAAFISRGEDITRLLLPALQRPMRGRNDMMFRSKVLDCVGVIGLAIGAQRFGPFFQPTWTAVEESLNFSPEGEDVSELHESCFGFISNMARAGGDEFFGDKVQLVVPLALELLDDDSFVKVKKHDPLGTRRADEQTAQFGNDQQQQQQQNNEQEQGGSGPAPQSAEQAAIAVARQMAEDDEAGGVMDKLQVRISDVDMRCAIVHAMGMLAEHCPRSFAPFVDDTCELLLDCTAHFYTGLRQGAVEALAKIVVSLRHEFGTVEVPAGNNSNNNSNAAGGTTAIEIFRGRAPPHDSLPPKLRAAVDRYVSEAVIERWREDSDAEVFSSTCAGLITLLETLGPVAVHNFIDDIVKELVAVVNQQLPGEGDWHDDDDDDDTSDEGVDDDDDDDDEGNCNNNNRNFNARQRQQAPRANDDAEDGAAEQSRALLDTIGELLEALCNNYGHDFARYFAQLAAPLDRLCGEARSGEDHVMAMGSLAEMVLRCGPDAARPHFTRCLQLALAVVDHTDEIIAKLNSCNMITALATHAADLFDPDAVQLVLKKLWILLQACKNLRQSADDTGHAPEDVQRTEDNALSAVCSLVKGGCIPFGGPIESILPTVFEMVPPKADLREAENCISCLAYLASHHKEQLMASQDVAVQFLWACAKCLVAPRVDEVIKSNLASALRGTVFFRGTAGFDQFTAAARIVSPPPLAAALGRLIGN